MSAHAPVVKVRTLRDIAEFLTIMADAARLLVKGNAS